MPTYIRDAQQMPTIGYLDARLRPFFTATANNCGIFPKTLLSWPSGYREVPLTSQVSSARMGK
ncbi:hypothetical protein [Aureliella helgolandensis]|uniref:Uncharacterized protein n=1 Tax=Aureliella helgolandensis TaxID=2527968 RepID=A0A518GD54_9BACT|nr:hypothetical protein [Aureliella helgolandensis]QDV26535.1 hypothetical protein Q31a_49090 [Aureliella helgolandensis]